MATHFTPTDKDPIRTVVTQSEDVVVVAWHIKPGQIIKPHRHPEGQDTWTILAGRGDYIVDEMGSTLPITTGDVVVAQRGQVHGVRNSSDRDLLFVSIVSPAAAGYELIE